MRRENETMEKLLDAILHVRSPEDFRATVTETLRVAYNEVSAAAWRDGLETFASEFERGMVEAHGAGLPAQECGVEVTDVIMAARAMAANPKQVPPPRSPRPSGDEGGGEG